MEDIYAWGLDFDDTKLEDELKYKAPPKLSNSTDQKSILIIGDKSDYDSVKWNMDKLRCSGVWVCINYVYKLFINI